MCTPVGIKAALKLMGTIIQCLVIVKTPTPADRRKGIAYKVPCKECGKCYIRETQRTLKVSLGVNKQAHDITHDLPLELAKTRRNHNIYKYRSVQAPKDQFLDRLRQPLK